MGFAGGSVGKKSALMPKPQETPVRSRCQRDPLERQWQPTLAWRIIMDRGAWQATVHGVTKSWTWLGDETTTLYTVARVKEAACHMQQAAGAVLSLGWKHPPEQAMATHSSILAWRIPRTEGPGGLQSMGSRRVGHDWSHLGCRQAPSMQTFDACPFCLNDGTKLIDWKIFYPPYFILMQ